MHTDVLIVGAGPSGLALANVLAELNVDFRIMDRKAGPVRQSRAALIHVRTLELLHRLGLADQATARGVRTTRVEVHAGGRGVAAFPLAGAGAEARTPFPYALALEQDRTEQLLIDGLAVRGGGVEWDTEVVDLAGGADGVEAVLRRSDAAEETVAARWVVGADGARSRVRHAMGLGFTGTTYDQSGLLADVDLDLPAGSSLAPGTIRLHLTRGGFVGMLRLAGGRWRLFGAVPSHLAARDPGNEVSHDAYAQVHLADLQRWLDEVFLVQARVTRAEWTALFRIQSRIARRFRAGSAFLVGDAAHIHSPAGGQGMNLGVGDAVNLGWKLALVAKGQACDALLDTYEAERRPVAETVLRGSDRGFALEATPNPAAAWARARLAPHLVGPLLRLQPVQARVFRLFAQTWISYRGSPAVTGSRAHGGGPRPGDRAPHGTFTTPSDTGVRGILDLTAGLTHDLLLFEGPTPHPGLGALQRAAEELLGRHLVDAKVHVIPATETGLHRVYGATRPSFFLLRPDGHVACTGLLADLDVLAAHMDSLSPKRHGGQGG